MDFPGRFHPLVVHLPIGFLILAWLLELLSLAPRFRRFRRSVPVAVLLGFLVTVISVITGLLLADEGGYDEALLFRHRLFAFMVAGFTALLLVLITYEDNLPKTKRRPARIAVFTVLIMILVLTGHFGGSLTHGEDYLTGPAIMSTEQVSPVPASASFYEGAVKPVLVKKCVSCHGPSKQKGKLRLDSEQAIRSGGKHGSVLDPSGGQPELTRRIMLSIEEKEHMPPREKDQLTSLETELIAEWVSRGASFEIPVDSFRSPLVERWKELSAAPAATGFWPEEEISPADEAAVARLQKAGARVGPVAQGSNYLEVVFTASTVAGPEAWEAFTEISPNVVTARFSFTQVGDTEAVILAGARNLRRLHLDHTAVTNKGVASLSDLKDLRFLNLVSSGVGPGVTGVLGKLTSLREVYLFETKVPADEIERFCQGHPAIKTEAGGYGLPVLRTDTFRYVK